MRKQALYMLLYASERLMNNIVFVLKFMIMVNYTKSVDFTVI